MKTTTMKLAAGSLIAMAALAHAGDAVSAGLDLGPLAKLQGTWKSVGAGGVDIAPGQANSTVGKGQPAVSPFYEVITFEPAADATNASDQYVAAMYYKQEVFRKSDNQKFHDQRGYLIYDKKNSKVYNSFCVPRAVCVVAEGEAGEKMTLKSSPNGISESAYMGKHGQTTGFTMTLDISGDELKYSQTTGLRIYGKTFEHVDSGALEKVK